MTAARALERLYAVPPKEFTRARNNLAAELRKARDTDAASAIARLRRPSATLWAVNQLAHYARASLERFLDAVDRLRRTQLSDPRGAIEAMRAERAQLEASGTRRCVSGTPLIRVSATRRCASGTTPARASARPETASARQKPRRARRRLRPGVARRKRAVAKPRSGRQRSRVSSARPPKRGSASRTSSAASRTRGGDGQRASRARSGEARLKFRRPRSRSPFGWSPSPCAPC